MRHSGYLPAGGGVIVVLTLGAISIAQPGLCMIFPEISMAGLIPTA